MGGSATKPVPSDVLQAPQVRERDRSNVRRPKIIADADLSAYDATADKYDFVVVFSHAKKAKQDVDWAVIEQLWFQAIPGDEGKKLSGVAQLKREWCARFGENVSRVNKAAFDALVREHVVEALSRKSLQLKLSLSPDGKLLYCQIRAPMSLLGRKADMMAYKLKFKDEVDPGPSFWSDEELREEGRLYTRGVAEELLDGYYAKGRIGPNDAGILPEETMAKQWSRRIHTLERIIDQVPSANRYPAYAAYTADRKSRHLFDEYPTVRGKTLFLPKDRLYLTKRLVDEVFDFEVLAERGIVQCVTALHDANFGEMPTTAWLRKRWVFFWNAEASRCGAPYVSHPANARDARCPLLLRPWAQPLAEVRAYYGEKIALYFAWLGFYGVYLLIPAALGLCAEFYVSAMGSDESQGVHYDQYIFAALLVIWTAYYKECWDVESQYVALKWGTDDFEEEEQNRPQFFGDKTQPRRISPITNQQETFYPEAKRAASQRLSLVVVLLFIVTLVLAIFGTFELAFLYPPLAPLVSVGQAVLIQIMSRIYGAVALSLNESENYRTQTNYENNLILKKFLFEIFNNFAALAITAFVKGSVFECVSGAQGGNCLGDVKMLLVSIMGTRFALAVLSTLSQHIQSCVKSITPAAADVDEPKSPKDDDAEEDAEEVYAEAPRFESELSLERYEGTFDDYAEIVLQMGLVSLFSLCWYVVPSLAVLEVLLQIRVDAYKLTMLTRRPDPMPAESVGSWGALMEAMGILAVFANAGIIVFTTESFSDFGAVHKFVVFFILEQAFLVLKLATHALIDDEPQALREIKKRARFVISRHKFVMFDDEYAHDASSAGRRAVDADALSVEQLRLDKPNKIVRDRLEFLRRKLLQCDLEIKKMQRELTVATAVEVWRDDVGVSYSRSNPKLALGMLTLTLVEAEQVGTLTAPVEPAQVRVIVHVRDAGGAVKLHEGAVAPPPQVSKAARKPKVGPGDVGQRLIFQQQLQLAPIKAANAVVHFELLDDANRKRLGAASLPLEQLADQRVHSNIVLVVEKPQGGSATLTVTAQFQYSKILPIKQRTLDLLDEQKRLHRDITNLQLGSDPENEWAFPDLRNIEDEKDTDDEN